MDKNKVEAINSILSELDEPIKVIRNLVDFIKRVKWYYLVLCLLIISCASGLLTYIFVDSGAYENTKKAMDASPILSNLLDIKGFIIDPIVLSIVPFLFLWGFSCLFYKAVKNHQEEFALLIDIYNLIAGTVGSVVMISGAWLLGVSVVASIHSFDRGIYSVLSAVLVIFVGWGLKIKSKPDFKRENSRLEKNHITVAKVCFGLGSLLWLYLNISEPTQFYWSAYQEFKTVVGN
ncbi:hypothetical protein QNZ79_004595 [Vibrio parahaemolyticus]|uniref:hypothetical protein n=1 Tax=Vibrio parahaemolyticus TaxID=670 RepID=UPI0009B71352|nr:hypothetical protein [Vibrio parahaemolyticus]ELB2259674.1 hypothetical protein [Vibrio parahaemolyticus]OQK29663.1 hypothetical protein XE88_c11759 [Vibrio parahaemolyticus]